jgi:hypothetical protein
MRMIAVTTELECPTCKSPEMHPNNEWCLIRAYKVHDEGKWWSQCLVCAGYYDKNLKPIKGKKPEGGWF